MALHLIPMLLCSMLPVTLAFEEPLADLSALLSRNWPVIRIVTDEGARLPTLEHLSSNLKSSLLVTSLSANESPLEVSLDYYRPVANVFVNASDSLIRTFLMKAWDDDRPLVDAFVLVRRNMASDEKESFETLGERFPNLALFDLAPDFQKGSLFNQVLQYDQRSRRTFAPTNVWNRGPGFANRKTFTRIGDMDFGGHRFRVIPMLKGHPKDFDLNILPNGTYIGTDILLFGYLEQRLNFKMRFVDNVDGKVYGILDKATGQWRGLVGMLQREEADWSLPKISLSASRLQVIDYVQLPYVHFWSAVTFLAAPPRRVDQWFTVTYPFDGWVWLGFTISFLLSGPAILLIYRKGEDLKQSDLLRIYNWMASVATGRGMKVRMHPIVASSILAFMTWGLVASFMDMAYTSMLASSLMVTEKSQPVNTWEDVLNFGMQINYPSASGHIVQTFLRDSAKGSMLNKVYHTSLKQEQKNIPNNVKFIHESIDEDPNSVYLLIEYFPFPTTYSFNASGFQTLRPGKTQNFAYGTSIPFRKHFPYLQLFNRYTLRFWCMGITKKLEDNMILKLSMKLLNEYGDSGDDYAKLELSHFLSPLVVIATILVVGILVFVYEVTAGFCCTKKDGADGPRNGPMYP